MASLDEEYIDPTPSTNTKGSGFSFDDINFSILNKFIQVLEAAAILIVVYVIILIIKKRFSRIEAAHDQQRTILNLLEKICSGFILVIGITLALKTVGLDISLLVSVGVLGLSYGLKDVIKNYIAGILIFFKSPFKIGDTVKIKNYVGKVEKMDLQSTSLKTFDNRDITIYNSDIMAQSIANYSSYPMRRMEIDISVGYGTNIEKAISIFDKILENEAFVLKNPKYSIIFKEFHVNGIVIKLKFWVKMPSNMLQIRSLIAWQIQQAFDEENLFVPYTKSVESDKDYTLLPSRIDRIKAFYNKAIFTTAPAQTVVSDGQQPVEFLDFEEPSVMEDVG